MICQQVETVDEYDEYCHYAAGLVGLGLSKLLLASGLEVLTPDWKQISNSTGLFLQVCISITISPFFKSFCNIILAKRNCCLIC